MNASRVSNPLVCLVDEVMRLQGRFKSIFAVSDGVTGLPSMELTVLTAVVEAAGAPTVPQIGRSLGRPRQVIQRAANAFLRRIDAARCRRLAEGLRELRGEIEAYMRTKQA